MLSQAEMAKSHMKSRDAAERAIAWCQRVTGALGARAPTARRSSQVMREIFEFPVVLAHAWSCISAVAGSNPRLGMEHSAMAAAARKRIDAVAAQDSTGSCTDAEAVEDYSAAAAGSRTAPAG